MKSGSEQGPSIGGQGAPGGGGVVENREVVDQKSRRVLALIASKVELFTWQGAVVATWRWYRGRKLGPYWRLAYRESGRQCSIYLGRSGEGVERVRRVRARLQQPLRRHRTCRRLARAIRASLRAALAEFDRQLERLGLWRKLNLDRPREAVEEKTMRKGLLAVAVLACAGMTTPMTPAAFGAGMKAPAPRSRAEVEAVLAEAPKPPPEDRLPVIHVVLLADVKDHGPGAHDYPLWQKRWALLIGGREAVEESVRQVNLFGPPPQVDTSQIGAGAANVELTTAWKWPSPEQLDAADLIVMQCYRSGGARRTWSEERVAQLEAFLARGGGFVGIHPATYTLRDLGAEPEGDRVAALTGMAFDKSILVRHGPMTVRIAAGDHPICAGLPDSFELVDEPYWPPVGDARRVTVLATSDEAVPKGSEELTPQPMFWTARHGKGRVFACVPGHFTWTFDDPYFRILLLRGMAWAAGGSPYRFDPLVTRGIPLK